MPLTSKNFGWLDNYYIWDAITSSAFYGASQQEIFDIFNGTFFGTGTEPAISLFETQSGIYNSLANLLYSDGKSTAKWLKDANTYLSLIQASDSGIYNNTLSIDTKSTTIATNTGNTATSVSSIDTKSTTIATNTGTTATNTGTIVTNTGTIATNTGTTATNTGTIASDTTAIRGQITVIRTPNLISSTGSATLNVITHSVSFYNAGSAAGTLTVSGGSAISIPAGATFNFDAGGLNNRFASGAFVYNATGTTFIISYVS